MKSFMAPSHISFSNFENVRRNHNTWIRARASLECWRLLNTHIADMPGVYICSRVVMSMWGHLSHSLHAGVNFNNKHQTLNEAEGPIDQP